MRMPRAVHLLSSLAVLLLASSASPSQQKPSEQKRSKGLGLPQSSKQKKPPPKKGSSIVLPDPVRPAAKQAPQQTVPQTPSPIGLEGFGKSLASKQAIGTEELIAEYSLLSDQERAELWVKIRTLPPVAVGRLAKVYRALGERRALPLLLARLRTGRMGKEARSVVDAVIDLAGERGARLAMELLGSRFKIVRRAAQQALRRRMSEESLPSIQELLDHRQQGTRVAAVHILGGWLRTRRDLDLQPLVDCLSHRDGSVRTQAAQYLLEEGERAVSSLLPLVARSSQQEGYYLAIYLLAQLELQAARDLLPKNNLPSLGVALQGGRQLPRSVAALVAALRFFRKPESFIGDANALADVDVTTIVDELLTIIDVKSYYPEFAFCHDAALVALGLLSGEDFGSHRLRWRSWWDETRGSFRPYRMDLAMDAAKVRGARLRYVVAGKPRFILLGPDAEEPSERSSAVLFRLTAADFTNMWKTLKARGLLNVKARLERMGVGSEERAFIAQNKTGQARDGFHSARQPRFRSLLAVLEPVLAREAWQEFAPSGLDAPGRRKWWLQQSKAMSAFNDERRRTAHVLDLACSALPKLDGPGRKRALGILLGEARKKQNGLTASQAKALLALLDGKKLLGEEAGAVLEVVAMIHLEGVFEALLITLSRRRDLDVHLLLPRLIALAGPAKIVVALKHEDPTIRETAAAQAAHLKDPKSYPALLALLADTDASVRAAAATSCGRLGLPESYEDLKSLAKDEDPTVRHSALVALGGVSGKDVYKLLYAATATGSAADRLAAVRGLSLLRNYEAGKTLVLLATAHFPEAIGLQALEGLRDRGGPRLRTDVRRAFQATDDVKLKREFLFLLGEMQDPAAFPMILSYMRQRIRPNECCLILAGISGFDACNKPDRQKVYEEWWDKHQAEGSGHWLIQAVQRDGIKTNLRPSLLVPGTSPEVTEELCLILEKAQKWPTQALAAHLLREITGKDYGSVQPDMSFGARQALAESYRAYIRARPAVGGK